jgi:hypothetical protein
MCPIVRWFGRIGNPSEYWECAEKTTIKDQSVSVRFRQGFFQIAQNIWLCKFCVVWGSNFIFNPSWWTRTSAQRPEASREHLFPLKCSTVFWLIWWVCDWNSDGSPTLPVMGRLSGVSPMHRGELYRDARGLGGLLLRLLFGIFSREGSYDIWFFFWIDVFNSYIPKSFKLAFKFLDRLPVPLQHQLEQGKGVDLGCNLTSVTVGKWISDENLFKRSTRKFIHFFHVLSCKNCALNRAVVVLPSVQKSCSRSCCFGVALRAKILL